MAAATIAFAPFDNLSGDPAEDYFARGFVEDIATELSRFRTVEVFHPSALAAPLQTHRGDSDRRAPADHIVCGSIRRAGERVRVNVQLVHAEDGRQLWADRYDATATELYAVQDAIAARIARTVALQADAARLGVVRRAPLTNLDVYDCWLRGLDWLRKGTVEADAEARRYFERALEIDPTYARAYAGLSLSHFNEWSCQAWAQWDEKERLAHEYAERAVSLDETDAMVRVVLGRILVYRRRYDEAAHHVECALLLNPNDTDVLVHAAMCQAYLGDPEAALVTAYKAMRLNPAYPAWYAAPAGLALFVLGRDRECCDLCAMKLTKAFVDVAAFVAAAHALNGDKDRAAHYLQLFVGDFQERIGFGRAPDPGEPLRWLLHVNPFRRAEDGDRLARGLALAGLEADPDEGRVEAIARPLTSQMAPATFRREGRSGRLRSEAFACRSPTRKASWIWRTCSRGRARSCTASSWRTGRWRAAATCRCSTIAPAASSSHACANSSRKSTTLPRHTTPPARTGRARSSIRLWSTSRALSASVGARGSSGVRPNARGRP